MKKDEYQGVHTHEHLREAFRDYIRIRTSELAQQQRIYSSQVVETLMRHRPTDDFVWQGPEGVDAETLKRMHEDFFEFFEMEEKGDLYRRIAEAEKPVRLLDAGCGIGSESLMFAIAGAEVTGVDLIQNRLETAKQRKTFFECELRRPLALALINADLFKVLDSIQFDAVWIREAISHIHPLEDFLRHLYKRLPIGGQVVVSDCNYLNPLVFKGVTTGFWKERRRLTYYVHGDYKDPQTGESVLMAEERVFTPFRVGRVFEDAGFKIQKNVRRGFLVMQGRRSATDVDQLNRLKKWERLIGSTPVLNWFGGRNVIYAEKVS
jgi:2-polyprenyl-3-methyl-5-hydroxy-6-metoxy-1,4-benzoquinol methylase